MIPKKKTEPLEVVALVLGIASIILAAAYVGILASIGGLVCASTVLKKKSGGLATGGLVCSIIGILLFLVTIFGGGSETENSVTDASNSSVFESSQDIKSEEAELSETVESGIEKSTAESESEEIEKIDNEFGVGEIVETSHLKIHFLSAEIWESDNQFVNPADGCVFYQCGFEFENISDSDQFVSSWEFECYADGYAVDASIYGDDIISATLSSGKKEKGFVYYEVPEDAESVILEYETNYWTQDKIVFVIK